MRVDYAPREDVEVERAPNVLPLETAPLERRDSELEGKEGSDCSRIADVLVAKRVKLVRLVIQGDLTAGELSVECYKVARLYRVAHQWQLLSEVLQRYFHFK